jgi:hypothetical protein
MVAREDGAAEDPHRACRNPAHIRSKRIDDADHRNLNNSQRHLCNLFFSGAANSLASPKRLPMRKDPAFLTQAVVGF